MFVDFTAVLLSMLTFVEWVDGETDWMDSSLVKEKLRENLLHPASHLQIIADSGHLLSFDNPDGFCDAIIKELE